MTKNISIIAAEFDSDYSGILVYVVINGVKHLYGEQLVEREYGFRRADVGDDDSGDCFTVIDDEENPQLDSEEQKIFDDIIDTGMGILGADEDGYIKPENRTVIKSNHYGVKKVGDLINFKRSLKMTKDIKFRGLDDVMSDFEQMRDSDHYFRLFLACNPASGELYSMLLRPFESPSLPAEYSIKLLTGQEMTRAQVIRYFTREIEAREAAAAEGGGLRWMKR